MTSCSKPFGLRPGMPQAGAVGRFAIVVRSGEIIARGVNDIFDLRECEIYTVR
ncbi:MAG: hypothetical protein M3Z23_06330 [Acidobacteriota bacterium]|nr:hypothetical protein [Acidobacteriota bacterium]